MVVVPSSTARRLSTTNTYVVVVPGSTARRLSTTNTYVVVVPGSTARTRSGTTNTYVVVVPGSMARRAWYYPGGGVQINLDTKLSTVESARWPEKAGRE